jgi:hypothetical protein
MEVAVAAPVTLYWAKEPSPHVSSATAASMGCAALPTRT